MSCQRQKEEKEDLDQLDMYKSTFIDGIPVLGETGMKQLIPVYHQELDMLGLNEVYDYDHSEEPILWRAGRIYYYRGNKLFKTIGESKKKLTIHYYKEPSKIFPMTLEKENIDLIVNENKKSLQLIEDEAIEYIRYIVNVYKNLKKQPVDYIELLKKQNSKKLKLVRNSCESFELTEGEGEEIPAFPVDSYMVSYSSGKDSTVLADLVYKALPDEKLYFMYSDTGYEHEENIQQYEMMKKLYPKYIFNLQKNPQDIMYYWDVLFPPSHNNRWCCSVMKTAPQALLYRDKNFINFLGVRKQESVFRSKYSRHSLQHKGRWSVHSLPIVEWSILEVWLYLYRYNLPIHPNYRRGFNRVGCVICPCQASSTDFRLSRYGDKSCERFNKVIDENLKLPYFQQHSHKIIDINGGEYWKWMLLYEDWIKGNRPLKYCVFYKDPWRVFIKNPNEDWREWIKIYGKKLTNAYIDEKDGGLLFTFDKIEKEEISILRKIFMKIVYCVHCTVCEPHCHFGALSTYPKIKIDEKKCRHCYECISINSYGCIAARSVRNPISEQKLELRNLPIPKI